MQASFDVAVVGLGAMGSAALYHLARRGQRVVGFDRYSPPHIQGSSHGKMRVIREAYFEHPLYVPLVQRAYALWDELEQTSGRTLFRQTGMLLIGPPDGDVIAGALRSARRHGLPYERFTAADLVKRYPMFRVDDRLEAVFEPRAGALFPEAIVETHLAQATRHGAEVRTNTRVDAWKAEGDEVLVSTLEGDVQAGRLLLAAGAWMPNLLPGLDLPLTVERQTMHWFEPVRFATDLSPQRCPIYGIEYARGHFFYGFPRLDGTVRVAFHHDGRRADPEHLQQAVQPLEVTRARSVLQRFLPDANGRHVTSSVCMYTNTPDHHFLIDRHPAHPNVWIASPCSGHGFKFASAIGEALADLLTGKPVGFDLSPFSIDRWNRR